MDLDEVGSISIRRPHASFAGNDEKRAWLTAMMNGFANASRPLAKQLSTLRP